jgi:hypothetical protein
MFMRAFANAIAARPGRYQLVDPITSPLAGAALLAARLAGAPLDASAIRRLSEQGA